MSKCTLGIGCDEDGVCYADRQGCPERCGRRGDNAIVGYARATDIASVERARSGTITLATHLTGEFNVPLRRA